MGHVRLGTLPKTRAWKDVIELIANRADVASIADATMKAADKAFQAIQSDTGFSETVDLMTQLASAARQEDPREYLESLGIRLSDQTSLAELAVVLTKALDQRVARNRTRSDFGELAHGALVGAVIEHMSERFGSMFAPTSEEVHAALGELGKKTEFGRLSRTFFAKLTNTSIDYFLSKTVGAQIGETQRFATTNQVAQFRQALELHCAEASEIVERFSGDWFSKHHFLSEGQISGERTEGFGWYAMQKMRDELKMRAKSNEP